MPIFKDPKTDNGLKKSQKGCCMVIWDEEMKLFRCSDGWDEWVEDEATALIPVYKDGESINEQDFLNIRARLYGG